MGTWHFLGIWPVILLVHWVGFDVSPDAVVVVHLLLAASGPATVENDDTWDLQQGDRSAAYSVMFGRVTDYLRDHKVDAVALIGSSVSGHAASLALLTGAELRGVVAAASASALKRVVVRSKGSLSQSSSRGRVDLYTKDDAYWASAVQGGKLRKGSREAAYAILTAAKAAEDSDHEPG